MSRDGRVEAARCANEAILDKRKFEVLAELDIDTRHYDEGKEEEADLPF